MHPIFSRIKICLVERKSFIFNAHLRRRNVLTPSTTFSKSSGDVSQAVRSRTLRESQITSEGAQFEKTLIMTLRNDKNLVWSQEILNLQLTLHKSGTRDK